MKENKNILQDFFLLRAINSNDGKLFKKYLMEHKDLINKDLLFYLVEKRKAGLAKELLSLNFLELNDQESDKLYQIAIYNKQDVLYSALKNHKIHFPSIKNAFLYLDDFYAGLIEPLVLDGADVNFVNENNENLLMIFSNYLFSSEKLIRFLVEQGLNLNHKSNSNDTIFTKMIKKICDHLIKREKEGVFNQITFNSVTLEIMISEYLIKNFVNFISVETLKDLTDLIESYLKHHTIKQYLGKDLNDLKNLAEKQTSLKNLSLI